MIIERPLLLHRLLLRKAVWRMEPGGCYKTAYLTFDDGPIPEVTPWVLDILDKYNAKATFFMVGENVMRYPEIFDDIKKRGHSYGNHTMHHLKGLHEKCRDYKNDVCMASDIIHSPLFRPPHGIMRPSLIKILSDKKIIMHDLLTRDYNSKITPATILRNIKRLTRDGSIIVFHDSLKARGNLMATLEDSLKWLTDNGYKLPAIPMER